MDSINRPVRNLIRGAGQWATAVTSELERRWPVAGRVSLELEDVDLIIRANGDDGIVNQLFYGHDWEAHELRAWSSLVRGARGVLDIGANTGVYAMLSARLAPDARVFAFEPNPINAERLRENVELNELSGCVDIITHAVGAEAGHVEFTIPDTGQVSLVSSAVSSFTESFAAGAACRTIEVEQDTVDGFLQKQTCIVDAMKVDVESYELEVLRGALETLRAHRPFVMCEVFDPLELFATRPELARELSPELRAEVAALLDDVGYTAYAIGRSGLHRLPTLVGAPGSNFIFSPVRADAEFLAYADRRALAALRPTSEEA
jgi:FkbM family methyltransferase